MKRVHLSWGGHPENGVKDRIQAHGGAKNAEHSANRARGTSDALGLLTSRHPGLPKTLLQSNRSRASQPSYSWWTECWNPRKSPTLCLKPHWALCHLCKHLCVPNQQMMLLSKRNLQSSRNWDLRRSRNWCEILSTCSTKTKSSTRVWRRWRPSFELRAKMFVSLIRIFAHVVDKAALRRTRQCHGRIEQALRQSALIGSRTVRIAPEHCPTRKGCGGSKRYFAKTANTVIREHLVAIAKTELINSGKSIAEISYALNFSDKSNFHRFFLKMTGKKPSYYRELFSKWQLFHQIHSFFLHLRA